MEYGVVAADLNGKGYDTIIIESAAMNNRQKKMGYNAAQELLHKLGMADDNGVPDASHWDNY